MNGKANCSAELVSNEAAAVISSSRERTGLDVADILKAMQKHNPSLSKDRYNYLFGRTCSHPNTRYDVKTLLSAVKAAKLNVTEAFSLFNFGSVRLSDFQLLRTIFPRDEYLQAFEAFIGVPFMARKGGFAPAPVPHTVIGREQDIIHIQSQLMPDERRKRRRLMALWGLPGVGKSDFMNLLLNDNEAALQRAFPDGVLWAEGRQHLPLIELLRQLGRQLGLETRLADIENPDEAANYVRQALHGLEVLVVVDGVWRLQDAITLKNLVPLKGACLFTTRFTGIAQGVVERGTDAYALQPLKAPDFRNLMRYLMPSSAASLGKAFDELAFVLGGLPLAARVAAARLERDFDYGFDITRTTDDLLRRFSAYTAPKLGHAYADASDAPDLHRQFHASLSVMPAREREAFARLGGIVSRDGQFSMDDMEVSAMLEAPRDSLRALIAAGLVEPLGAARFKMHPMMAMYARYLQDGGGVEELVYEGVPPL